MIRELTYNLLVDLNKLVNISTPILFYYNSKSKILVASDCLSKVYYLNNINDVLPLYNHSFTFILNPIEIQEIRNTCLFVLNNKSNVLLSPMKYGLRVYKVSTIISNSGSRKLISHYKDIKLIRSRKLSILLRKFGKVRSLYKYLKNCSK